MGARVAVAGASGYAGGELLRLLAGHPALEIGPVAAGSSAGTPVTAVHPQLTGHPGLDGIVFTSTDPDILAEADLLFTALPHGESAQLAVKLPAALKIIDLSADFRLGDPDAWSRYYPTPHAGQWTYGLPELPGARAAIKASTTVAAPGCYATASILALAPLLAAGLADPADIVIVAASGTSGAGRAARLNLLGSEVMGSMSAYQVGGTHRHTPEIEQAIFPERTRLSHPSPVTVSFTPTLAPMARGILATCTARLTPGGSSDQIRAALAQAYAGEPFVHLLAEGRWPATGATYGSNAAHLQAAADTHAGRAIVVCALDNLVKGAAGQAIQIANLMLGLPETAGLTAHGVAP
ncbi:MAG: N-acetyl-gamma-glutamyl-phosphate reductase [Streptosporangiaceae bacterium]|jgi:N-acetyl-gamma-glutamyl-phosphate reductase